MAWQPKPNRRVYEEAAIDAPSMRRRFVAGLPANYATFQASARGLHRVFNAAGYRFYRSNVAPPAETDTPFATSTTLPSTPGSTFADGTWYLSASDFDGVLDSGFLPIGPRGQTYLMLEISGGVALATRPSQPTGAALKALAAGVIEVTALYSAAADGINAATQWAIAYTTDGSTPATSSPTIEPNLSRGPGLAVLAYKLPAQADGTTVNVQLQVRRSIGGGNYSYSLPLPVLSAIASTTGPAAPLDLVAWPGAIAEGD